MSTPRHVFRWDLDKTYLRTEFDTVGDLVRTARLSAEERENIPGSAALLRAIKFASDNSDDHLVFFISGSPNLIRAVLEKKFNLDGFQPDGFTLKPTLSDVMRGRFRAVRAQVAYKLIHLLRGRANVPIGVPETLFGDDAENDAFIYSLYADFVAGAVSKTEVVHVAEAAGAYPHQLDDIREGLEAIVHEPAIGRIVIHLDRATRPEAFAPFGARVVPIANHLQTALVLALDGTLAPVGVRRVAEELIERYGFNVERLIELGGALIDGFGARHPGRQALGTALHAQGTVDPPSPGAAAVLEGIAAAAARPVETVTADTTEAVPRDYLALWARERERAARKDVQDELEPRLPATTTAELEAPLSTYARGVAQAVRDDEDA